MKENFNFKSFVYEVYAKATPSVDLATTTETIQPWNHKLDMEVYNEILDRHCDKDEDLIVHCNLWMLNSGPQLTNSNQ